MHPPPEIIIDSLMQYYCLLAGDGARSAAEEEAVLWLRAFLLEHGADPPPFTPRTVQPGGIE